MADPALDPHNPDETGGPETADAARTTNTPDPTDEAPDLEAQVEDLLAEVSDTVDEIQRKLSDEAPPEYTDIEDVENELAAFADAAPDGASIEGEISDPNTDAGSPETESQDDAVPAEGLPSDEPPVDEPLDEEQPGGVTISAEQNPEDQGAEDLPPHPDAHAPGSEHPASEPAAGVEPEPVESETAEAIAGGPSAADPMAEEPVADEAADEDRVAAESIEDIQAALEDAIGDPEPPTEVSAAEPDAGPSTDETVADDAISHEAEADAPPSAIGRAPVDQQLIKDDDYEVPTNDADAPPDDTDAGALDDELATLAADGVDEVDAVAEDSAEPESAADDPASEPHAEEPAAIGPDAEASDADRPGTDEHETDETVADQTAADELPSATGRAPADQQLIKDDDEATDPENETDTPPDYTDAGALEDELAALAAEGLSDDSTVAEEPPPEPEAAGARPEADDTGETDAPPDYTDAGALDDELAALAAEGLGDDSTVIEAPQPEPADAASVETDDAPVAEPEPAGPAGDTEPHTEAEPEPSAEPVPVVATTADTDSRHPGWLPPKPEWPEVYSRWRPLVIAWRHAAWVVPPFLAFAWATAWAWLMPRAKSTAIKAEPHVRLAIARAATPLSKRDEKTRSIIGWFAIYTLFVSACLWVYILVGRSPVAPTPDAPETALARETATADAKN